VSPILLGILDSGVTVAPVTNSYVSIASTTLTSDQSNITFDLSGLSANYKHLQFRWIARNSDGSNSGVANLVCKVNTDTTYTNYRTHLLTGNGSTATSSAIQASDFFVSAGVLIGNGAGSNIFGAGVLDVLDAFSTTKYKTFKTLTGGDVNGGGQVRVASSLWTNTNALTTITFQDYEVGIGINLKSGTSIALYGIKD
jgi:hypothetical protein